MRSDRRSGKILFYILFVFMAAYYGWRLFALTPWYDELYTYYYFISRGPLYAALHWPLPNNHVGYSVLSAVLDCLGNSHIGLRGLSWICSLMNLWLLYRIGGRYLTWEKSLGAVVLYLSMNLVNQMAVQGRGYTLGITCFLLAWECMSRICERENTSIRYYLAFVLALILGLYAVPSNVYWVVPLCLAGGVYLLHRAAMEAKQENSFFLKTEHGKKLLRLTGISLCAALATILLYALIWAAIGSNLLVKEVSGPYYGMGHVSMILKSPVSAVGRGMRYMLDTPYIQREERAGFGKRLWEWLLTLSGSYYSFPALALILIWGGGLSFLGYRLYKCFRGQEKEKMLLYLVLLAEIVFVPVCLLIQCKRPYYRVFTYGGVLLALLLGLMLGELLDFVSSKMTNPRIGQRGAAVFLLLVLAFGVKCLGFSGYNEQYGTREHEIQEAFKAADVMDRENICVTDCNQEYLLYFLYGIRCENREIDGSDMVLLDKRMTDPDFDEMVWEFYHYYDSVPWDYIEQNMMMTYENEDYILYTRNH